MVRLADPSAPERLFEDYLENNAGNIDWWYKNGDSGMQHFAIAYTNENGGRSLFYPDFIIRMKDGRVYIFDTKSPGSDPTRAHLKHNALIEYIAERNAEGGCFDGGVAVRPEGKDYWIYPRHTISGTSGPYKDWKQLSL